MPIPIFSWRAVKRRVRGVGEVISSVPENILSLTISRHIQPLSSGRIDYPSLPPRIFQRVAFVQRYGIIDSCFLFSADRYSSRVSRGTGSVNYPNLDFAGQNSIKTVQLLPSVVEQILMSGRTALFRLVQCVCQQLSHACAGSWV